MPGPLTTVDWNPAAPILRPEGQGEGKAPPTIGEVWTASREYQAPHNTNWEDIVYDEEFAPLLAEINRRRKARGELALLPPSWGKAPDNRLRKQVGPNAYGVTGRTVGRREAAAGILAEVERERDFDPQAFAGIDTDVDKFMAPRFAKEKAKRAKAGETLNRASGVVATGASFFGGMTKAFEDPLNLATLPVGGGGRTFAARVLSAGAANAGVEFLSTPTQRRNLSLLGEDLTTADAARNIAMAGVGGALFQGGAEGVGRAGSYVFGKAAERMPLDWRLAQQLKREVPVQLRTPEQQAAIHVVERGAEIDATSPWRPTHQALDAHAERLQDTMERLNAPDPAPARPAAVAAPQAPRPAAAAPSSAAAGPRVAGGFEMGRYMARNRVAESGGVDTAAATTSSAYGRYQFLKETWLLTYRAEFGKTGETDAQILAKRADGATQDRVMARFTRDNIKAMEKAGVPVTDGTVYLAHFLGPADAIKVLKAAPETPVRGLVSGASIGANPAVFGKINSTGQLVSWAQRKMAQDPGAVPAGTGAPEAPEPIVRPAELDADPVVAEAPVLELDRELFDSDASWRVAQAAVDAEARGLDVPEVTRQTVWADARDRLMADKGGEAPGALWHPEVGPIDVKWGDAKAGLAKIIERHPEVLTDLPALLDMMEVVKRSDNRIQLESRDHAAAVRLDWDGQAQTWLLTAFEREGSKAQRAAKAGEVPSPAVYRRAGDDAGASPTAGTIGAIALERLGINPAGADTLDLHWGWALERGERPRAVYGIIDQAGGLKHWEVSRSRAERQLDRLGIEGGRVQRIDPPAEPRQGELDLSPAVRDMAEAEGMLGPPQFDPAAHQAFADPAGDGVRQAADSAWHDIRNTADPAMVVDLGDGRGARPISDIEAELDADLAAIEAMRGCL